MEENIKSGELQAVTCRVEIGIPVKLIPKGQAIDWKKELDKLRFISKLGECPVLEWNLAKCSEVTLINNFGSWRYNPLPKNRQYLIGRFWLECITPDYDVFGIQKMEKGEPGNETVFRYETEEGIIQDIKIIGRAPFGYYQITM